ncbi:MAG: acyl-ACP--UDP-N-acetylglucosamine O-acyltransferase [Flavobacteriales bacterium]|jgi:UDP-N-acetylglucosamine acyltransferase|nr:acyl-ACP--UDP-N-acetylglucosamine O-acyltransferase [Flavobacteriales bacterium]MDP7430458.1 acyl-ACP--UDP-N-acetylglucosamine O-acyltransferase [Flavobacteriales bacterium]HJN63686.1 acyl-ACP--UDP-N-acetylglucosamine O-acyltransferase [Flavobacteriales bacterium]|tara:strand:- start:3155 stop:3937 length:783 start_codon:yes stop_codon:yes gene_type:complete
MHQPLSYVHPSAKIANNAVIEPFVTIDKNVTIGKGSWIGSNVTIMEGATIGENCRIFPGAVISAIPQDLKFGGEKSEVIIGDNTTIRECVTINRGTEATGKTEIGNNCLLMAYCHVAHDCYIGNNCVIVNSVALGGHITIGDWVIIGGLSAIHQFVHIGSHAMISGGALVRKDVPPFVKAAREPLSFVGINSIGLRRRGFKDEKIQEIQNIYRILFQSNKNTTQAIAKIEAELPASPEKDNIISFIQNSGRGIMKGYIQN